MLVTTDSPTATSTVRVETDLTDATVNIPIIDISVAPPTPDFHVILELPTTWLEEDVIYYRIDPAAILT